MKGYVYILTNKSRTVLYIGATSDLNRRMEKHVNGKGAVFTKRYHLKYLIYYEIFDDTSQAYKREKQLKNWKKEWKWNLISSKNPDLLDLFKDFN